MPVANRRYPKEEFAQRGDAVYERDVAPRLSRDDAGKFAAIDIETGEFEVDEDELAACDRLSSRIPEAQIWLVRVGSRHVTRFGCRQN